MPALHCLVAITPFDPVAGTRLEVRLASAQLRTITGLGGMRWFPALSDAPTLSLQLFNGDFSAPISPGGMSLRVAMKALTTAHAWPNARRYYWPDAEVVLYAAEAGTAWPWPVAFRGRVADHREEDGLLTLSANVDGEPFERDVLSATYAGTGGIQGVADLAGKPRPLVIGHAQNVEPVAINQVDSIYQFSGYGPIEAVTTLYERGSAFGASLGDYASYTALQAATVAKGAWATCLAEGLVKLGAPAVGVITGDIRGHVVGATTPRLSGAIIRELADIAGVSETKLLLSSLTALDAAVPYSVNIVVADQVRFGDLARQVALPCNAQAGIDLLGRFFVARVNMAGVPASPNALRAMRSREEQTSPPFAKTTFGAARCWRVHSPDEIATDLTIKTLYEATAWYRFNDLVSMPDGSMWRYINAVPGVGNAPPASPGTSNAWWNQESPRLQSPRGEYAAASTYSPGDNVIWTSATGGDGNTYARIGSGQTTGASPSDATKWSLLVVGGTGGAPGLSVARPLIYQRAETMPALPSAVATFTFATGVLTGLNNGWTTSIPDADGNPLWVSGASASGSGTTDTIAAGEWASPVIALGTGTAGADGLNQATVPIYRRAATTPALPSVGTTYTFATGGLAGLNNSWSRTIPANNGDPLWISQATAISPDPTDTIPTGEWSAPQVFAQNGEDGADGTHGLNNANVVIFRRSAVSPPLPGSNSTYTFATAALTGLTNGWTVAIPGSDESPLWAARVSIADSWATHVIAAADWSAPSIYSQDGAAGENGITAESTGAIAPSIPCYSNGAVKPGALATANGTMQLRDPEAGVIASGVGGFAVAGTNNCSATIHPTTGAYSFSSINADTASALFGCIYAGTTFNLRVSLTKVPDGQNANQTIDTATVSAISSTSYPAADAEQVDIDIVIPGSATANLSAVFNYTATATVNTTTNFIGKMKITTQNISDGGGEVDLTNATGGTATTVHTVTGPGEFTLVETPSSASISTTFTNPSGVSKIYRIRLYAAKSSGSTTGNGNLTLQGSL